MTTVELIESLVIVVLVAALAIYYINKAVKNNWIQKISSQIDESIREAEDLAAKGEIEKLFKKEYVLNKVKEKCIELGIPYYLIEKLITRLIERVVRDHNVFVK